MGNLYQLSSGLCLLPNLILVIPCPLCWMDCPCCGELWDRRQSDNFELLCNKCDLQLHLAATLNIPTHQYDINTRENFGWWSTQIMWFTAMNPLPHHTEQGRQNKPIWQKQDIISGTLLCCYIGNDLHPQRSQSLAAQSWDAQRSNFSALQVMMYDQCTMGKWAAKFGHT